MLFEQSYREVMQSEVSAAIDDVFGERVTVIPAKPPAVNFQAIADHSRAVTVTAVFTQRPKTTIGGGSHGGSRGNIQVSPLISTSEPIFSFGYGVLPWPLMQGYQIKRCNGDLYEVTDIKPDGVSRIDVNVN
ncbi:hypothetical protein GGQ85_002386 [Nitrobacter vulgaris]|jgi:hypothetical protein|uniref:hypothetical protein n=1 Tax=Nitrobacter vulgaris TaxID=29421 RepID=UPI00285A5C61|nr:hypothetical protein [Nitrobacter vulgaris]MDR6304674.1 hypothetical protein [Nitrobacter vulgaris]